MTFFAFFINLTLFIPLSFAQPVTNKPKYYDCLLSDKSDKQVISRIDFRISDKTRDLKFEKNDRSSKLILTYSSDNELSFSLIDTITGKEVAYGSAPVVTSRLLSVPATSGNKNLFLTCRD